MPQEKQSEWLEQWSMLQDNEMFLFKDWIYPFSIEDFRGKDVLEGGCGGGQHTAFVAEYARSVTAADLNAVDVAKEHNRGKANVSFVEADIAEMDLGRQFDVVFCIGVVHHTDDPDKTVRNLARHTRPGGRLILWVYSKEGNALVEHAVEPLRKLLLAGMSRESLLRLSRLITLLMYVPIYTVYLLPLRFLPFYEYFGNFRRMTFYRNALNVFDKLNAPQVQFISGERARGWLPEKEFRDVHISPYKGVSWRVSGTKL
ncbi:MAG: class I SAM-dependent methyltransferase [Elusimicrobia bacterium]|nr:class I SAM-dependent methyltransferase [Elusimicrobiota bacterium]